MSLLLVWAQVGLCAEDAPVEAEPELALESLPKSIRAGEGGYLPAVGVGERSGWWQGDVEAIIEHVVVRGDRLDFRLTPLVAETGRAVFESLIVQPAEDGSVVLDTRHSQLPQVAFRGLLEPQRLSIQRQAIEGAVVAGASASEAPQQFVTYLVLMDAVGVFDGAVSQADGTWQPVAGDCQQMVAEVTVDVIDGRLGVATLTALDLEGADGTPARLAIDRPTERVTWHSQRLRLSFDSAGQFQGVTSGADTVVTGEPLKPRTP